MCSPLLWAHPCPFCGASPLRPCAAYKKGGAQRHSPLPSRSAFILFQALYRVSGRAFNQAKTSALDGFFGSAPKRLGPLVPGKAISTINAIDAMKPI
ncbi:zinc finger domain-containing protein [Altericroceibacterium spongiae]|uniref:zinc finger domain-containing protein n=1 Tax=Altericroceibacterium spongiae TaxID=2320269 RepID=UPI003B75B376